MKHLKKLIIGLLAAVLTAAAPISTYEAAAAAKAPGLNARITEKNIMKILDRYDSDGAYILKKQKAAGDNILIWFSGSRRIIDSIDTAVHEETHGYSFRTGGRGYAYYVGKKKSVNVAFTPVYQSRKMAASIPRNLRMARYNLYVANPSQNLSSNIHGVYGLLNEFMAYRMGMNNTTSLYSYYAAQNADWNAWQVFVRDGENGKMAYAEFKYYTLHYLYYAKKHYPKVYKDIIRNRQFCRAYRKMESSYRQLISTYEKELKKLQKLQTRKGNRLEITKDALWFYESGGSGGTGIGRFTADYNKLLKELKKSRYTSIHKKLVNNGK